jgi:hypothetical protein
LPPPLGADSEKDALFAGSAYVDEYISDYTANIFSHKITCISEAVVVRKASVSAGERDEEE